MKPYEELNTLRNFGNIPVRSGVLSSIFPDTKALGMKIMSMERQGLIVRLKRGLYVVSPEVSGKRLSLELIANHIYGPSYVSFHYALRHYGLIPEHVVQVTSATTRHTKMFLNSLASFSYRGLSDDYFPIGIRSEESDGISYLIATPEKAICDMIMKEPSVPNQSVVRLEQFFEEDMRIDLDDLRDMNKDIIQECLRTGNKKSILSNLLKLIER